MFHKRPSSVVVRRFRFMEFHVVSSLRWPRSKTIRRLTALERSSNNEALGVHAYYLLTTRTEKESGTIGPRPAVAPAGAGEVGGP
jgi:hypothetical protein